MPVSPHLSDLFFNHDTSSAAKPADLGGGFDPDLLQEEAEAFLGMISGFAREIGCPTGAVLPTAEELVADYLERI